MEFLPVSRDAPAVDFIFSDCNLLDDGELVAILDTAGDCEPPWSTFRLMLLADDLVSVTVSGVVGLEVQGTDEAVGVVEVSWPVLLVLASC